MLETQACYSSWKPESMKHGVRYPPVLEPSGVPFASAKTVASVSLFYFAHWKMTRRKKNSQKAAEQKLKQAVPLGLTNEIQGLQQGERQLQSKCFKRNL